MRLDSRLRILNKILIIMILTVLVPTIVHAACVVPTENMLITTNTTLCSGTYYLGDNDQNGAIQIGSNANLICNETIIIGNNITNSYGIKGQYSASASVSIAGCTLKNYYYGIYTGWAKYWEVYNNNLIGNNYAGIIVDVYPYDDSVSDAEIHHNIISYSNYTGILIQGAGNIKIYNNIINNSLEYGLWFNRMNKSEVFNNEVYNTISNSIRFNDDNTWYNKAHHNIVANSGWNCLDTMGRYNNFTNNNLNNCSHNALNANSDNNDRAYNSNNYIANNFVNNSGLCIYIDAIAYSTYTNNTCYGQLRRSIPYGLSLGVSSDGIYNSTTNQITTHDNTISNNYFNGFLDYAIQDNSINSSNKYLNNKVYNSAKTLYTENYYGTNGDSTLIYSINNTEYDDINQYQFNIDKLQIIKIEDYSKGATIKLNTNRKINITYDGFHNITIYNQSITIYDASSWFPYNDVKDTISGEILASNINTYTLNLNANQQIIVGNFTNKVQNISQNTTQNITQNVSQNTTQNVSQNLTPINMTVTLLDLGSTLSCNYDVSGNDVELTVQWYRNNAHYIDGVTSIDKAVGTWYCIVNVTDPFNKTYRSSNNITISAAVVTAAQETAAKAASGGGGAGADYVPLENDTPNSSSTETKPSIINPEPIPVPVSEVTGKPELVTNSPVNQVKDALLEQPKEIVRSASVPVSTYVYASIILLASLTTIVIVRRPKNVPTNTLLQNFVDQSLYAGYTKEAIRHALKSRYSKAIINHHLTGEPTIRYKDPVSDTTTYSHVASQQLKEYIRHQRLQGFKDKDIKDALLHYGYSNKIINEVYHFELA